MKGTISERLRKRGSYGDARLSRPHDALANEAADTIDALELALLEARPYVPEHHGAVMNKIDAALAKEMRDGIPEDIMEVATDVARKVIFEANGNLSPAELRAGANTVALALMAERKQIPKAVAADAMDIMDATLLADMEGEDPSEVIARALREERKRAAQIVDEQIGPNAISDAIRNGE